MDHNTKLTYYNPPRFEPTPVRPLAACLPTIVLRRCGHIPLPTQPFNVLDIRIRAVRRIPTILGVP